MDWIDYVGDRFGIREVTDKAKEVTEFDNKFDEILDEEGWK